MGPLELPQVRLGTVMPFRGSTVIIHQGREVPYSTVLICSLSLQETPFWWLGQAEIYSVISLQIKVKRRVSSWGTISQYKITLKVRIQREVTSS
jgi:uncharacterized membrane protein